MKLIKRFKELMSNGHKAICKENDEAEKKKLGVFRVGSTGAIVDGKLYPADCGRKAQARYLGYQLPIAEDTAVMFQGGFAMEDLVAARLQGAKARFNREKPTDVVLENGIKVSGRPDFEVEIDGEWIGVEVKSLASPFSVTKFNRNSFPFMKHMVQAASYMVALKRTQWMIVLGHSFNVNERGFNMPSTLYWYELTLSDGHFYITNDANESSKLPFQPHHILAYYQALEDGLKAKKLVDKPTEKELNVDTYNRCNYCPLKSACNKYDNNQIDFEQWLGIVQTIKENAQSQGETNG